MKTVEAYLEWRDRAEKAEARVRELVEALEGLLDGLDANTDGRDGLSNVRWESRIKSAHAALAKVEEEK